MRAKILITFILTTIITGSIAYAVTLGTEPPVQYINNLKTCTKSTYTKNGGSISEYKIKGKLPNGRCEVYISSYTNYADPKVYEGFKTMALAFGDMANSMEKDKSKHKQISESDIPTQAQMIEEGKKEKDEMICKFSEQERKALYEAYQKHDSKNPPAKVENGNVSFSFDSSKMSSYDKLMVKLSNGPCMDPKEKSVKVHVCEYADTTCYYKKFEKGGSSLSCSNDSKYNGTTFALFKKVEEHINAGMCSLL